MRISYSAIDTYQTCPLKYKFQNIDRIKESKSKEAVFGTLIHSTMKFIHTPALLPPKMEDALEHFSRNWNSEVFEVEAEERAAFSQGVAMIQNYYKKNDPASFNIISLESRFNIEIGTKDEKHILSGTIDRIDKIDEGYEIIDYKTTKKMPSQDKVDNDLQLSVYLKAFLDRYPKEIANLDKINVSLYYLKHGVKLTSKRTMEQLQKSEELFLDVINLINESKFEPNINPLCDWCGFQRFCPMWKHKFKENQKMSSAEINQVIAEYLDLNREIKEKKTKIEALQEKIGLYMDNEGVERVFGDNGVIARVLRRTYKYDEKKLREILEPLDHWEEILKVDGVALKNVLGVLPQATRAEAEKAKIIDKESKNFSVKKNV